MSYNVFPTLAGLAWDIKKRPVWSTVKLLTAARNEFRTGYGLYPLSEFDLSYGYLSLDSKLAMEGFLNQQMGSLNPFYFDAQNDNTIAAGSPQQIGTGDGSTTNFRLLKPAGTGAIEPIGGPKGTWVASGSGNIVYVGGTAQATSSYTVSGNVIVFGTAPAASDSISWSGQYYYLVRFNDDFLEFNQLANLMWELEECKLVVVR